MDVWRVIDEGASKRCQNLKTFLNKMLASKSLPFLKEAFQIYMEAIAHLLNIECKFKQYEIN